MLLLVSYSFPPDNSPAAHRPFQLARCLSQAGIAFRLYARHKMDATPNAKPQESSERVAAIATNDAKRGAFAFASRVLRPLLEVDKALPWGLRSLPLVWLDLLGGWLHERRRPDVWATAPGVTNLYVAGIAAILSGSRLHVDLRDAIRGISSERMPLLTWLVLRYASTCSVVTDSLARFVHERAPFLRHEVIYNGISSEATSHALGHAAHRNGWIRLAYAGAVYGGARPYESALAALREAAEALGQEWQGIELTFVGREDVSTIIDRFQSTRLRIVARGEMSKEDALQLSALSDANLVLIGSSEAHRCGIPLKVFDLLGVGRPIFYHGPVDADGCLFLQNVAPNVAFVLDSEATNQGEVQALSIWLAEQAQAPTNPIKEPAAASQSMKIVELIGYGKVASEGGDIA